MEFLNTDFLENDGIKLVLYRTSPADPAKNRTAEQNESETLK